MKTKKLLLLAIMGLAFYTHCYSQAGSGLGNQGDYKLGANSKLDMSVSLSSGMNFNDITFSAKNRVYTRYVVGKVGFYVKGMFSMPLYKVIDLHIGVSYLNKNYRFERTGKYYGDEYSNYYTRYLNAPILLGIKPLEGLLHNSKFSFDFFAGGYLGYWVSLTIEGVYGNVLEPRYYPDRAKHTTRYNKSSYDFVKNENQYNRFDYGLQFGGRLSYTLCSSFNIFAEYSCLYGLSDNEKAQLRKTSLYYYTTNNVGLGVSYTL